MCSSTIYKGCRSLTVKCHPGSVSASTVVLLNVAGGERSPGPMEMRGAGDEWLWLATLSMWFYGLAAPLLSLKPEARRFIMALQQQTGPAYNKTSDRCDLYSSQIRPFMLSGKRQLFSRRTGEWASFVDVCVCISWCVCAYMTFSSGREKKSPFWSPLF